MLLELNENIYRSIEVERSKFIAYAYKVSSIEEFEQFYDLLKKEHQKARHICYAYIIGDNKRFSDDGEPSGTAGKPILNVIEKSNLINTAVFVVRYFGGTLLGSGRLLRTYVEASKMVIDNAKKIELVEMYEYKIRCEYDFINQFKYFLKTRHFVIKHIEFNDKIEIDFLADLDFKEDLEEMFYKKIYIVSKNKCLSKKE